MGHFYFVRHGQTVWNVEGKICGATDIALTELGHEQAIATGKRSWRSTFTRMKFCIPRLRVRLIPQSIFLRLPGFRREWNRA